MAVREDMGYLIQYVRTLVDDHDEDPGGPYFTDQDIQDRLDLTRKSFYTHRLDAKETLVSGGTFEYHDYHAARPFWESDAVLQKGNGTTLTPDTSDWLTGHWHFNADQATDSVYITGKAYDVYGACAGLLSNLISRLRKEFNFTADGMTIQRITQVEDLNRQADMYRRMSWGLSNGSQLKLYRSDIQG